MAARKTTTTTTTAPAIKAAGKVPARSAAPTGSSPVRNTPIPKPVSAPAAAPVVAPRREITQDMIARRAYEIYSSGTGGSEFDNWTRAERELRSV